MRLTPPQWNPRFFPAVGRKKSRPRGKKSAIGQAENRYGWYLREQMCKGIEVCKSCHKAIHDLAPDEKELGRHYNTVEKLLAHPEIGKYVPWKRGRAGASKQGSRYAQK